MLLPLSKQRKFRFRCLFTVSKCFFKSEEFHVVVMTNLHRGDTDLQGWEEACKKDL